MRTFADMTPQERAVIAEKQARKRAGKAKQGE